MQHWCPRCQKHVPTNETAMVRIEGEKRFSETSHHCRECKAFIFVEKHEIKGRIESERKDEE